MVTYDFYKNTYLGSSITAEEWPILAARAQDKLKQYKRIYTIEPQLATISHDGNGGIAIDTAKIAVTDDGKGNVLISSVATPQDICEAMAVCAMADALAYFFAAQNGMGAVASASIGSVSVSYGNAVNSVDLSPKAQGRELYRCARQYLDIYRGVG